MPRSATEIAQRYVPGEGPVAIERLSAGLVNESYRAVRNGRAYALRLAAGDCPGLALDREWECRVLGRASAAGIAPHVECCDPQLGVLVGRWVEGRALTREEAGGAPVAAQVAALALRIHALPIPPPPRVMSPADWIERYRRALEDGSRRKASPSSDLGAALEALAAVRLDALARLPAAARVICHSDLHVHNVVAHDRGLVLLDWEYAHLSEPFWDLAGWAANNDLPAGVCDTLLTSYLGRGPTETERSRFEHLVWLYDYVCVLWGQVYLGSGMADAHAGVLTRTQTLTRRLAGGPSGSAG
jgi:thiamine kinase